MTSGLRQMVSFGLVGLVNTAIGFGTIVVCQVVFGLSPVVSNVIGYAAGLTNSYIMNRAFTFRGSDRSFGSVVRFAIGFGIAYGANLVVLLTLTRLAPEQVLIWQGLAMITYTVIFFLISKYFVFRPAE